MRAVASSGHSSYLGGGDSPRFFHLVSERLRAGSNIERLAGSFDSLEVGEEAARQQEKEFRPRGYR